MATSNKLPGSFIIWVVVGCIMNQQTTGQVSSSNTIGYYIDELQAIAGLTATQVQVSNWAGTASKTVVKVYPQTRSQLSKLIDLAKLYGLFVRASGALHAFSDHIAETDHVFVDMSQYESTDANRLYATDASYYRQYSSVTLNPSVTLAELQNFMVENGLTLPSFPSSNAVSVAGILATGTHGYNDEDGAIGVHLRNIQVLNSDGNLREFDSSKAGSEFQVFMSNMGICGIIIRMRFEVYPAYFVAKYEDMQFPLETFFFNSTALKYLLDNSHSFLTSWTPMNSLPTSPTSAEVTAWDGKSDLVDMVLFERIQGGTSEITDAIATSAVLQKNYTIGEYTSAANLMYGNYPNMSTIDLGDSGVHSEFAFSIDSDSYSKLMLVLETIVSESKTEWQASSSLPFNKIQLGFWKHNSSCLLCHSNVADSTVNPNSQSTLILGVNFIFSTSQQSAFDTFMEQLYSSWQSQNLLGLPHPGKYVPSSSTVTSTQTSAMATKVSTFKSYRELTAVDSIDIFTNKFVDSIVFPSVSRSYDIADVGPGGSTAARFTPSFLICSSAVFLFSLFFL